jgi:hypothetical protein
VTVKLALGEIMQKLVFAVVVLIAFAGGAVAQAEQRAEKETFEREMHIAIAHWSCSSYAGLQVQSLQSGQIPVAPQQGSAAREHPSVIEVRLPDGRIVEVPHFQDLEPAARAIKQLLESEAASRVPQQEAPARNDYMTLSDPRTELKKQAQKQEQDHLLAGLAAARRAYAVRPFGPWLFYSITNATVSRFIRPSAPTADFAAGRMYEAITREIGSSVAPSDAGQRYLQENCGLLPR